MSGYLYLCRVLGLAGNSQIVTVLSEKCTIPAVLEALVAFQRSWRDSSIVESCQTEPSRRLSGYSKKFAQAIRGFVKEKTSFVHDPTKIQTASWSTIVGNITELAASFPDHYFDRALLVNVMEQLPKGAEKNRLIDQLPRIIRPDGLIAARERTSLGCVELEQLTRERDTNSPFKAQLEFDWSAALYEPAFWRGYRIVPSVARPQKIDSQPIRSQKEQAMLPKDILVALVMKRIGLSSDAASVSIDSIKKTLPSIAELRERGYYKHLCRIIKDEQIDW